MTTITVCPADIADILLRIMQSGIVMARAAGWGKDADLAVIEADHVHNLPGIVRRYDPEKLVYYWDRERPSYRERFARHTGQEPKAFDENWAALEPLMSQVREGLPAVSSYHARMQEIIRSIAEGDGRAGDGGDRTGADLPSGRT